MIDREAYFQGDSDLEQLFTKIQALRKSLSEGFKNDLNRDLPWNEMVFDRWERASQLGFGTGSNIYDSSLVLGDVSVGEKVWIGPYTILDGSGGLTIGDHCTVSSGTHIYTHNNIEQTLSGHIKPIERSSVQVGNCTYIGPNAVITMGVSIGKHCLVGSGALVNKDVEDYSIVVGTPARVIGTVEVSETGDVRLNYHN